MRQIMMTLLTILSLSFLVGCTPDQRQDLGIASGAVVGGVIGNAVSNGNPVATVGGAVVGGVIGNELTQPDY